MALPFSVPTADAIPQGAAQFYAQQPDGSLRLTVEGVVPLADHQSLQKSLHAALSRAGAMEAEAKKIKGLFEGVEDLEAFRRDAEAAQSELAMLRDGNKDVSAKIAEAVAGRDAYWKQQGDMRDAASRKKLEDATKELERIHNVMRQDKLLALVASSQGGGILKQTSLASMPAPMALGALLSILPLEVAEEGGSFQVVAKDPYGNPFPNGNGQPMTGEEALKTALQSHPQRDHLFVAQGAGGSGSPGGGQGGSPGKNPWKKETFNLTEQGKIERDNPELARRLRREAGKG